MEVVVYPKDTEKWKQFTTTVVTGVRNGSLLCIPKILKNESNSQQRGLPQSVDYCCCVSQRYWKMKAIHNARLFVTGINRVVVYPKDTEKWKQFTTPGRSKSWAIKLLCIPKILKNESNSQHPKQVTKLKGRCCVSQRYWKMKAIHNVKWFYLAKSHVVVYPKDTEKWKQFTTN